MNHLYTDPEEDVSVGIRHIPVAVILEGEGGRYREVLKKYPPAIKIGFRQNQVLG